MIAATFVFEFPFFSLLLGKYLLITTKIGVEFRWNEWEWENVECILTR